MATHCVGRGGVATSLFLFSALFSGVCHVLSIGRDIMEYTLE